MTRAPNGCPRPAYTPARRRGLGALALAALAAGPAGAQPYGVRAQLDLAYGPLPAEVGDLFSPSGPAGRKPAVVVIHGGGWVGGSRHGPAGLAQLLASRGAGGVNLDYRLADKAQPTTRWPAQLVDAQLAVRFLRAHAAEFDLDPARIGALGDSAGAQLAVLLGTLPRIVPGDGAGLYPGVRPDVRAVVDQYGPMDLPGMGNAAAGSIDALFGLASPSGGELLTASPLPAVTAHSAPAYILHGTGDQVVPFQQSRQLADTLRAHGVAAELVPFNGGHAYEGVSDEEIARLQINALRWLMQRLR